jgi:hypothetical protein
MPNNNNLISGTAMMVITGVILLIAPWFATDDFSTKIWLSIIGVALIVGGGYFSKG